MDVTLKTNFTKMEGEICILIATTGSVAALKIPILVGKVNALKIPRKKSKTGEISDEKDFFTISTRIVTTMHAKHFFNSNDLPVILYEDEDEWTTWKERSDPVLHIELRRWADLMVIAPLDANTLAKMANGLCDNLVSCVVRAWDFQKPLLFAPSMNTFMWDHPITTKQIKCLTELGYEEIPCVEKVLVCGDKGMGAMAEVDTIVKFISDSLHKRFQND